MSALQLVRPSLLYAEEIGRYRAEFPVGRMEATPDPQRIPGLFRLEEYRSVEEWLRFCEGMRGRISWYLALCGGRLVGCSCLRHRLEYDDDDPEFASHIGYSIRPDERGKGFGKEQLRLVLGEAKALGIDPVRVVCRDTNLASCRVILANGGRLVDALRGEESGMTVLRWDIPLSGD